MLRRPPALLPRPHAARHRPSALRPRPPAARQRPPQRANARPKRANARPHRASARPQRLSAGASSLAHSGLPPARGASAVSGRRPHRPPTRAACARPPAALRREHVLQTPTPAARRRQHPLRSPSSSSTPDGLALARGGVRRPAHACFAVTARVAALHGADRLAPGRGSLPRLEGMAVLEPVVSADNVTSRPWRPSTSSSRAGRQRVCLSRARGGARLTRGALAGLAHRSWLGSSLCTGWARRGASGWARRGASGSARRGASGSARRSALAGLVAAHWLGSSRRLGYSSLIATGSARRSALAGLVAAPGLGSLNGAGSSRRSRSLGPIIATGLTRHGALARPVAAPALGSSRRTGWARRGASATARSSPRAWLVAFPRAWLANRAGSARRVARLSSLISAGERPGSRCHGLLHAGLGPRGYGGGVPSVLAPPRCRAPIRIDRSERVRWRR